ncbi:MAG: hypothetical protein NWF00_09945 [Candidatus Bathyarchaeota archaeon]|nr:hypothetical protein [Candidatus Bathyarchaeota archaeon]
MVVAGKIFKLSQPLSTVDVAAKLNGYHIEEDYEEGDYKFGLVSEVTALTPKPDLLTGVYSSDYVIHVFHRGTSAPLPRTVEAMFSFAHLGDTTFLAVVERKRTANLVANKLSSILFGKAGVIVNARITPQTLKAFHDKNPEETKITFFDDVDIPNVDKLSLYGPDLNNTSLFEDYMKHGNLWYVVGRSKETGYVVGITRDASVTIFNLADKSKYLEYLAKEIYSMILESSK